MDWLITCTQYLSEDLHNNIDYVDECHISYLSVRMAFIQYEEPHLSLSGWVITYLLTPQNMLSGSPFIAYKLQVLRQSDIWWVCLKSQRTATLLIYNFFTVILV